MPFDGTLVIEKQVPSVTDASLGIGTNSGLPQRASPRAIPPWCVNRRTECVASAVAVLSRARELIADERRWTFRCMQGRVLRGAIARSAPSNVLVASLVCRLTMPIGRLNGKRSSLSPSGMTIENGRMPR